MSDIRGTTRLVGLIGWPVVHSLSPQMNNAAFAALELDWAYVPLPTPPVRPTLKVARFKAEPASG